MSDTASPFAQQIAPAQGFGAVPNHSLSNSPKRRLGRMILLVQGEEGYIPLPRLNYTTNNAALQELRPKTSTFWDTYLRVSLSPSNLLGESRIRVNHSRM